jgi:hypothetical protein
MHGQALLHPSSTLGKLEDTTFVRQRPRAPATRPAGHGDVARSTHFSVRVRGGGRAVAPAAVDCGGVCGHELADLCGLRHGQSRCAGAPLAHGRVDLALVSAGLRLARRAVGAAMAAAQVGQGGVPRGVLGYGGAKRGRLSGVVFALGRNLA